MMKKAVLVTGCIVLFWALGLSIGQAHGQTYYVLAPSGLNLRKSADPSSDKIATLSYGAKLSLLSPPASSDMRIDNLKGGMAKVSADGQTGYVFDGYLSRFPAPVAEMTAESYSEFARRQGLETHYESHHYDYDGYYIQENGVTLLKSNWQEAFIVAKALAQIPPKINFPPDSKKKEESFENPDKRDIAWSDELTALRDETGQFTQIRYYYRGEGGGTYVNISYEEKFDGFLIMLGGIAD